MNQSSILEELADRIIRIKLSHPIRVAIDGVDAAGKTTIADGLATVLRAHGKEVIRASIDGFHNQSSVRHQRGNTSPEGYYHDSFNYLALLKSLLIPLGPNGTLEYCSSCFDYRTDSVIDTQFKTADPNAVLLFDGVFLLRSELCHHWDYSVFVEAAFEVTLRRAMKRDLTLFGSADKVRRRYEDRYIPGQKIYLQECRPKEVANAIVDNKNTANHVVWFALRFRKKENATHR